MIIAWPHVIEGNLNLIIETIIKEKSQIIEIKTFLENDCNVLTTSCKSSFPIGIDVMVFRLKDLEWVEKNILDSEVREHVSLYFVRHPEKYRTIHLFAPKCFHAPNYRFILDYPEDLEFIRTVYSRLEPAYGECFGLEKIMELLKQEPDVVNINKHCKGNINL